MVKDIEKIKRTMKASVENDAIHLLREWIKSKKVVTIINVAHGFTNNRYVFCCDDDTKYICASVYRRNGTVYYFFVSRYEYTKYLIK